MSEEEQERRFRSFLRSIPGLLSGQPRGMSAQERERFVKHFAERARRLIAEVYGVPLDDVAESQKAVEAHLGPGLNTLLR